MKSKIVIVVATVIFLASCGKSAPGARQYALYLEGVRGNSAIANSMDDSILIGMGDAFCKDLDGGKSLERLVSVMNETPSEEAKQLGAMMLVSAVHNLCPKYNSDLETLLSTDLP